MNNKCIDFPTTKQHTFFLYDDMVTVVNSSWKRNAKSGHVYQGRERESESFPYYSVEQPAWSG